MYLPVPCGICAVEDRRANPGVNPTITFYPGRVIDDGFAIIDCKRNHRSAVILDHRKHELIFHAGCEALLDGHEREAINDFAAAQERMREFFLRAWCHDHFGEGQFDKTWKQMAKQSERQLGGLYIAYGIATGQAYELNAKLVELRNKIVHQAFIPEESHVMDYGRYAFGDIWHLTKTLKKKHAKAVADATAKEIGDRRKKIPAGMPNISFRHEMARLLEGTRTTLELINL